MTGKTLKSFVLLGATAGLLAACQMTGGADQITTASLAEGGADPARTVMLVDRDVEAPEDFQTTDKALWDGRPSIGGVWVAATGVTDPMRVIMRNPDNGKFVIGALFRREADNPGPALQISSDAAEALGMTAGEPVTLSVTALRREEVAVPEPDASQPLLDSAETVAGAEDVAQDATAAIQAAPVKAQPAGAQPAAKPTAAMKPAAKPASVAAKPAATAAAAATTAATAATPETPAAEAPATPAATGGKLIQIGIFSLEANAKLAFDALTKAGIKATISQETSHGKPLWSVTARGDKALLDKIKAAGFADAYFL